MSGWQVKLCDPLANMGHNKVNLRQARLVLGWVTSPGFNSRCRKPISVYNQPPRSTQPGHPSVGRRNEYQPKGSDALQLGVKAGMVREWVPSGEYEVSGSHTSARQVCVISNMQAPSGESK